MKVTDSQVIALVVQAPDEEQQANGADQLAIVVQTGLVLQPPNLGANAPQPPPITIPYEQFQFALPKNQAKDIGQRFLDEAEKLPDPKPHIETATSLQGVEQVEGLNQQFRKGPVPGV